MASGGSEPRLLLLFRFLSRPMARRVRHVRWITPNRVTLAGFALSVAGVMLPVATGGTTPAYLAGSLLMLAGILFDTLDGDLARVRGLSSPFGGWLDGMLDRLTEAVFIVVVGFVLADPASGSRELALLCLVLAFLDEYAFLLWSAMQRGAGSAPLGPGGLGRTTGLLGSWLSPGSVVRQLLLVAAFLLHRPQLFLPAVALYDAGILAYTSLRRLRAA